MTTSPIAPTPSEQRPDRDALGLQGRDDDPSRDHEGGVEHVDGGDDAGALRRRRKRLKRGEGGHDDQTAGHRQQGEIDGGAPRAGLGEIGRRLQQGGCPCVASRKARKTPRSTETSADDRGADGGRQQHDLAVQQESRKAGADANRDGEDGEMNRHHLVRAMQGLRDERGQQRHHDGADQPKNAGDDAKPPQFRFAPKIAQQHKGRADNIGVDAQFRRGARRRGNEPGGGVARERRSPSFRPPAP